MKPTSDESLPLFNLDALPLPPAPGAPSGPAAPPDVAPQIPPGPAAERTDAAPPRPDDDAELVDWKDDLRRDFEVWLASIDEISAPPEDPGDAASDPPDLYSFYEQLAAASAESRKANRRTAEAMSQWGETLARFENGLQPLREAAAQLTAAQPVAGRMARAHCLILVELLDRMHRLAGAFASPPAAKRAWWGAAVDRAWRQSWEAQHQALDILVGHVEALLAREGVSRIATAEQPFDPAFMLAVAAEPDATRPPQTVVAEVAAGFLRDGELLRAAQVKVTRQV